MSPSLKQHHQQEIALLEPQLARPAVELATTRDTKHITNAIKDHLYQHLLLSQHEVGVNQRSLMVAVPHFKRLDKDSSQMADEAQGTNHPVTQGNTTPEDLGTLHPGAKENITTTSSKEAKKILKHSEVL
jgi:hypothetical protein